MRWRQKARVQNVISRLPSDASYEAYYRAQRRFGSLRHPSPVSRLTAGVRTWDRIAATGRDPRGGVFFEIGTGRIPLVPLAFWLMGADQTVTVDLNPYLKDALARDHLTYIRNHSDEVATLFGDALDRGRFDQLLGLAGRPTVTSSALLETCAIDYRAPADAAETHLADDCIDFHTSCTTFEHIPIHVLAAILAEGNRIVRPGGLFAHRVDYSDHFSHSDRTITAINFLQFDQSSWDRLAGNRYMYMNRLRHDDYLRLFEQAGHVLVSVEPDVDEELRRRIGLGELEIDQAFATKTQEVLATTGAWFVTRSD